MVVVGAKAGGLSHSGGGEHGAHEEREEHEEPGEDRPLDIDALGYEVAALPFWQIQQAGSTPGMLPPRAALYFQGPAGLRAQKLVQQLYDVDFALYNYSHADLPL